MPNFGDSRGAAANAAVTDKSRILAYAREGCRTLPPHHFAFNHLATPKPASLRASVRKGFHSHSDVLVIEPESLQAKITSGTAPAGHKCVTEVYDCRTGGYAAGQVRGRSSVPLMSSACGNPELACGTAREWVASRLRNNLDVVNALHRFRR